MMNDIGTDPDKLGKGFSGIHLHEIMYKHNSIDSWKIYLSHGGGNRHDDRWLAFSASIYYNGHNLFSFYIHENCSLYNKLGKLKARCNVHSNLWRDGKVATCKLILTEEEEKNYFLMIMRALVMYGDPLTLLNIGSMISRAAYANGKWDAQHQMRKALGLESDSDIDD